MNAGIRIDEDAFSREALGAMACDGVTVIKMTMLCSRELNGTSVIKPCGNLALRGDGFDDGEVPICNTERLVWSGELDAVTNREVVRNLAKDANAGESARIVIG